MQQTFKLRRFKIDDLKQVTHINMVCLPENYSDQFFIDIHQRFPETFIVGEEDGKAVGYIMCRIETGLSGFGLRGLVKKGHIVSVAVLSDYRRQGIGQALVTRALENMKVYKAKQCFLEVRMTNNSAIDLYKKLGFETARTVRCYYADGEDAYVMAKNLSLQ